MVNVGGISEISDKLGLDNTVVDAGLITRGSWVFVGADNLTTEKLTSAISLNQSAVDTNANYLLAIDKGEENTAGDLTIKVYNVIAVDGSAQRNCRHVTLTVEKITDESTYQDFIIQGLFKGQGQIVLGASFATDDTVGCTIYFALYRF